MTTDAGDKSYEAFVTAVATTAPAPEIESQQKQQSAVANPSIYTSSDDDVGNAMGIAMIDPTMTTDTGDNSSEAVVTAVATTAPDIESQQQQKQQSAVVNPPIYASCDDDAGKAMGIAMVVLLLVALICTFFVPIVPFICLIEAIFIASSITCGCCDASNFNLKPNVKRFATATLVSLCLMFIAQILWLIAMGTDILNTGTVSQSILVGAIGALSLVFNILAIVFSALFTWGRGYGASRS